MLAVRVERGAFGEGDTALVGGARRRRRSRRRWIFTRSEMAGNRQGARLTIPGERGRTCTNLRRRRRRRSKKAKKKPAVPLWANRRVLGRRRNGGRRRAAREWQRGLCATFTRTGQGASWSQGTELSSPEARPERFGVSLALSADGSTIVVGAPRSTAAVCGPSPVQGRLVLVRRPDHRIGRAGRRPVR